MVSTKYPPTKPEAPVTNILFSANFSKSKRDEIDSTSEALNKANLHQQALNTFRCLEFSLWQKMKFVSIVDESTTVTCCKEDSPTAKQT